MDERRELISLDDEDTTDYYKYGFCLRSLYEFREPSCRYYICGTCAAPFLLVADILAFFPQCIVNNVKLCLQ